MKFLGVNFIFQVFYALENKNIEMLKLLFNFVRKIIKYEYFYKRNTIYIVFNIKYCFFYIIN